MEQLNENYYQETLLRDENTREILVGCTYSFNNDESIKSLFIDGEEYFIVNEVYDFCNSQIGSRHGYIRDELKESNLTITLNKFELLQGGIDLNVNLLSVTNKVGITRIISLLDFPSETRISFVEKEILNSNNQPERPLDKFVKYMILPISILNFDTHYQRKVSNNKVREIAKKFDSRVVGALIVSKRADGYYLIDGQHRVSAMELNNVKSVMCAVHENLTIAEEADLFWKCNNARKQPTALDNFKALILSGDKDALAIYNKCTEVGYTINIDKSNNSKTKYCLLTVSGLQTVYRLYGIDVLEKALRILHNANIQKPSTTEIHGLSLFLSKYQDIGISITDFADKLSKSYSQTELLAKSRTMSETLGGHVSTNYARLMLSLYNNKKSNRLEDRFAGLR